MFTLQVASYLHANTSRGKSTEKGKKCYVNMYFSGIVFQIAMN